jgi:glycosyltransferase involved in cell wall biosynthesis
MEKPLVSIIVPSFNQGRFIGETLESILSQDYRPLEVLVFDGGSSDETVEVLRSFGDHPELQWWSERDAGVVDAVNKGLAKARGAIQAIQSSDDLYVPGAISAAVQELSADSSLGLVYGDADYIDAASRVTGSANLRPWSLEAYVAKRTFIPQPAAFFTRKAAEAAGPWRQEVSYAADAEFFLSIASQCGVKKIDKTLARYRYHDDQRDKAGPRIARDWEGAVRHWLASTTPPSSLRRKALAGIHATRAHYMTDAQWLPRTAELYRTLRYEPSRLWDPDFPARELLPGKQPIWKFLSRIKRALGLRPR